MTCARSTGLPPYANNARTHSRKQIGQIAESIRRFGFTNQVLVADDGTIFADHGRMEAPRMIGMKAVTVSATLPPGGYKY